MNPNNQQPHPNDNNPNNPNANNNYPNNPNQPNTYPGNMQPGPPPNYNGHWSPQPPNGPNAAYRQQPPLTPNSQSAQGAPVPPPIHPSHNEQRYLPPVNPYAPNAYPPGPPQMGGYPPSQPAPRQRTAIACRYCRRRKIRCSGFDQSEDGRCTNCVRFSQECIFTPVSAQTQAFVPAHALYRGQNAPANQPLYGAYGQPLPPHANRDQQPQQQQFPQQQPGQYPPTPQGYQQQPMYPQQPPPGVPQMQEPDANGNIGKEAVRKNNTRDQGVQTDYSQPPKEPDFRKGG